MKRGKGDSYDGLTSDYLINGTEAGSMTDVKHYKGIALSSLFCKLFDTYIIAQHYAN